MNGFNIYFCIQMVFLLFAAIRKYTVTIDEVVILVVRLAVDGGDVVVISLIIIHC